MTLRPIRSEADYTAALEDVDRLFGAAPGTPEADRLEVLAILIAAYEAKRHALPPADPVDVLSFVMKAQGRTQSDLAEVLGSRSRASEILKRQRRPSAEMIVKLSHAWKIPAELLATPYATTGTTLMRAAKTMAVTLLATAAGVSATLWHFSRDLPDHQQLAAYQPPSLTRYAADGRLAEERAFIPLAAIPPHVVKAFLAAEDQDFYGHGGIDISAIGRAMLHNAAHAGDERALQGASTITQQVARNLLLSDQPRSLARKVREVVLAHRLEAALSKDRILELYLNQIYFGGSAYGVAAAARTYFGKAPADLTVAEAAYLAALPKAPNDYRITLAQNLDKARIRRDWVLGRMAEDGFITASAAHMAKAEPLRQSH